MRSLLTLFLLLSARSLASRPFRSLLALSGLSLAITLVAAVGILNHSTVRSLDRSLALLLGRTAIELTAGAQGLHPSLARKLQRFPEVEGAASVIEQGVRLQGESGALFTIFATDLADRGAQALYGGLSGKASIVGDPLLLLSEPNAVAVAPEFARRRNLAPGSRFLVMTHRGSRELVVRGILPAGKAAAFGGDLAVMDLPAAQLLLGQRGRIDRVEVAVREKASVESAIERLRARFPGLTVRRPRPESAALRRASASVASVVALAGLITLAAGAFLIFNLATLEAEDRQSEMGILYCLGAERRTLLFIFAAQGALLGLAAGAIGVAGGLAAARLASRAFAAKAATIASAPLSAGGVSFHWPTAGAAIVVGVVASTVGFFLAALPLARAPWPRRACGSRGGFRGWDGRRALRLGAPAVGAALGLLVLEYEFYLGGLEPLCDSLLLLAVAVAFPHAIAGVAAAARKRWGRWLSVESLLALRNLERASLRSGSAVAVLALSVAVVLIFACIQRSIGRAIGGWVKEAFAYDLEIASQSIDPGLVLPLDQEFSSQLATIEGVGRVYLVRWVTTDFRGVPVTVHSLDYPRSGPRIQRLLVQRGDPNRVYREVALGRAVAVSENFASRFRVEPGDTIRVSAPRGPVDLKVAGVAVNYNSEEGTIMMSRRLYRRFWKDRLVNYFLVALEPGAETSQVRRTIAKRFAARYGLVILTLQEAKAKIDAIIAGIFRWIYTLEAVAGGIGLLTVLNTMSISVLRRRPQLALLRAAGAEPPQAAKAVRREALLMGAMGALLGGLVGTLLSVAWVKVHLGRLLGWIVDWSFPWEVALATLALAILVSGVAGFWPAHLAAGFLYRDGLREPGRIEA